MLKPAILYKDKIIREFQKYYYTEDMMYETASLTNWSPNIEEEPDDSTYQYAIVNKDSKLLGFMSYKVDWYASQAYGFGLLSFDRGNPIVGRDVFNKLTELAHRLHRIEWRAVGGNPACRGYDHFIEKYDGNKHILKDAMKDRDGNYRDCYIYEIISKDNDSGKEII